MPPAGQWPGRRADQRWPGRRAVFGSVVAVVARRLPGRLPSLGPALLAGHGLWFLARETATGLGCCCARCLLGTSWERGIIGSADTMQHGSSDVPSTH
jgi:hypothetical protein